MSALRTIKLVHTAAWALFAGCIVALPVVAWSGNFRAALTLIAVVLVWFLWRSREAG
jgi:hypothetical protein